MGDSFLHEDVGGESTSGEHCDGRSVGGMGVNDSLVAGHWGRWSMRRQGKVDRHSPFAWECLVLNK